MREPEFLLAPMDGMTRAPFRSICFDYGADGATTEMIQSLAERYGTRVIESEIVGLTPAKALIDCAEFYLKAKDFDCKKQVMEYHLIDMNH